MRKFLIILLSWQKKHKFSPVLFVKLGRYVLSFKILFFQSPKYNKSNQSLDLQWCELLRTILFMKWLERVPMVKFTALLISSILKSMQSKSSKLRNFRQTKNFSNVQCTKLISSQISKRIIIS